MLPTEGYSPKLIALIHQLNGLPVVRPGNLDIYRRPVAHNPNGSISTVRSITVTDDQGRAFLLPTVIGGRVVSNQEAINHWKKTGQNLGVFASETAADRYAGLLHQMQAYLYANR